MTERRHSEKLIRMAIRALDGLKAYDNRKVMVNDVPYIMVEISLRKVQQIIDLLEESIKILPPEPVVFTSLDKPARGG